MAKLAFIASGIEPITYIALVRKIGQRELANTLGFSSKTLTDDLGVISTGLIIVFDDNTVTTGENISKVIEPLAGAHRVASRCQAEADQSVNIFLALDDPNRCAVQGRQQFR